MDSDSPALRPPATVLVIDPDKLHVRLLRRSLEERGYDVIGARRGDEGLEIALNSAPDLVLLDVPLPGMDGLEVCRRLRRDDRSAGIPVIIVSGLGSEADIIVGLEIGADDYVTRPYSPRELVARIRAVLRRRTSMVDVGVRRQHGGLAFDGARRTVTYEGLPVPVTAIEFRILECLLRHPGRAYSRADILKEVHSDDVAVADRTIDVHLASLRRKLGRGARLLETMRGFGYRICENPSQVLPFRKARAARALV